MRGSGCLGLTLISRLTSLTPEERRKFTRMVLDSQVAAGLTPNVMDALLQPQKRMEMKSGT